MHPEWTRDGLEKSLGDGGIKAISIGFKQPFLGPVGVRHRIGASELQAYIYGDAVAVARDTDPLDSVTVAPRGTTVRWPMPATLIVDNNLAVILLTKDAALREQVRSLLKSPGA